MKYIKTILKFYRLNEILLVAPQAAIAVFLFSEDLSDWPRIICFIVAVFAGFLTGNIFNSIADRDIDEKNPRTSDRPLASRTLSLKHAFLHFGFFVVVVLVTTALLNPWYLLMLPLPVVICLGYSLSKRFTWLCHVALAVAHAIPVVGGWIVFGDIRDWRGILLGAIIFFWTVAVDMIYSSQDMEADAKFGVKSIPICFGCKVAGFVSLFSHLAMVALFIVFIPAMGCNLLFIIAVSLGELLLILQYALILINRENVKYAMGLNEGFTILLLIGSILNRI